LTGAMARVPVPGTPLSDYGSLPERELAKVIAVTRLASGPRASDICVHPPTRAGVMAGANTVVVETGAIPRDMEKVRSEWLSFTLTEAKALLAEADYDYLQH
jgi:biotin synthase